MKQAILLHRNCRNPILFPKGFVKFYYRISILQNFFIFPLLLRGLKLCLHNDMLDRQWLQSPNSSIHGMTWNAVAIIFLLLNNHQNLKNVIDYLKGTYKICADERHIRKTSPCDQVKGLQIFPKRLLFIPQRDASTAARIRMYIAKLVC